MTFNAWHTHDIAKQIHTGIGRAVAFNAALSPGLCPTKIVKQNPPVGARSWYLTEEGRRLYELERQACRSDYHGGLPFPLPTELEVAAIIQLCSGYLSIDERFKLAAGSKRRVMADQLAQGAMRILVWGDNRYSATTHLYLEDLTWVHVKLMGLPLSFCGAEIIHTATGQSLGRMIGDQPLFRKLSELALRGETKSMADVELSEVG